jgi:hypothetical protein
VAASQRSETGGDDIDVEAAVEMQLEMHDHRPPRPLALQYRPIERVQGFGHAG